MRRLYTLLCAAGLAVAPSLAAADAPRGPLVERFEWSTMSSRGQLGVMIIGITPELRRHYGAAADRGVLVARVEAGSPAAAAGLEVGDVLTEVRGQPIDAAGDVLAALASAKAGDQVAVGVIRAGQPRTLQVKLAEPPPRAPGDPKAAPRADGGPRSELGWPRWVDELMRRMQPFGDDPGWLEDMLRPWRDGVPGPGGKGPGPGTPTTRTSA